MSWLRYSDDHRRDPVWDNMPYDSRWHYDCLVEACAQRYDGRLPVRLALRCSDVDDPQRCLDDLAKAGLVVVTEDEVTLPRIDQHVPPPSIRDNAEKSKVRMRRMRRHRAGDHSLCLPASCADATHDVTADVTRNPGTGRDGTGNPPQEHTPDRGTGT